MISVTVSTSSGEVLTGKTIFWVSAGWGSERLMKLLEDRLEEEEAKPREPKKVKKYLFE